MFEKTNVQIHYNNKVCTKELGEKNVTLEVL